MTMRERAADFLNKLSDAAGPLLQDHSATISLKLTASEFRVVHAALDEFTAGDDEWQPISSLPGARDWDIEDGEQGEDVSLARATDNGEPLFFLLQEKDASGVYQHTKWRSAIVWPKPPNTRGAPDA